MVGREQMRLPWRTFATEHFTMTVTAKNKVNHVWAFGEDCIPVRMITPEGRNYELIELTGDPR